MSKTYDINDMGFMPYNNEAVTYLDLAWNIYKPVWKIMNSKTSFFNLYSTLSSPASYTLFETQLSNNTTFRNYWSTAIYAIWAPFGFHDYYEPRTWGWVYKKPPYYTIQVVEATDIRKKFRVQVTATVHEVPEDKSFGYKIILAPRFRFSDRFNLSLSLGYDNTLNNYGYVFTTYDSIGDPTIFFGRRDLPAFNNILSAQYIFNTRMSLSLRVRHNWSKAIYYDYYTLNKEGTLDPSDYEGNHDLNFNAFTVDLQYTWYFAPGSELTVVWKNAINTLDNEPVQSYFTNIGSMFSEPQANSISLRILYYLDYLYIKKAMTRKGKGGGTT